MNDLENTHPEAPLLNSKPLSEKSDTSSQDRATEMEAALHLLDIHAGKKESRCLRRPQFSSKIEKLFAEQNRLYFLRNQNVD